MLVTTAKYFLVLTSLMIAVGHAAAGDLSAGHTAWSRGDYATAIKTLLPHADKGNPEAQFAIGRMHAWGHGVKKDNTEAIFWFRMAARQGHREAQAILAKRYISGKRGVPQDHVLAAKWYRKAAKQRHVEAQYGLGELYAQGRGMPRDYVAAHLWFNLAAANGHKDAANQRAIVSQKLKPEEIAKAQKLARNWTADADK